MQTLAEYYFNPLLFAQNYVFAEEDQPCGYVGFQLSF
jgi:hypothetical protein